MSTANSVASAPQVDGRTRYNLFFGLYFLYASLMLLDFFLTKSPYSALHSGTAGASYLVVREFFISPAYLVAVSLLCLVVYSGKLFLDYRVMLAMGVLLVSGIYTAGILTNTATYVYNAFSFTLMASLAVSAVKQGADPRNINWRVIAQVLTVFLALGVLLALAFPNQYGVLPFAFSRQARGEVTLWHVLGLYTLYPSIAIVVYRRHQSLIYIMLSLLMTVITISAAYRAPAVISLLPFALVLLFNKRVVPKLVIACVVLVGLLYFGRVVAEFLLGGSLQAAVDPTNGRAVLWVYNWETFIRSPLLGAGAFFLTRIGDYSGRAVSEVGALRWFSENGILYGLILVAILVKSTITSIRLLARGSKATDCELLFALIMLSQLPALLETHGRILNADNLIFWFAAFFLSVYRGPLLKFGRAQTAQHSSLRAERNVALPEADSGWSGESAR